MIFVDGLCEHGAALTYFGMIGTFKILIGFDHRKDRLKYSRQNTSIYNLKRSVELV
jgi:hypothetical protein